MCELFAGVGGFRLGFERLNTGWETVWFSQWEPSTKSQWAHDCYIQHFGDSLDINGELHTNEDISLVDKSTIPDHTVLVGGFPCQDYSVAQSLSSSKGIEGKKGVLWWQIRDVLAAKRPPFCILENVDRLLKSPSKQRGRDFGIILACFAQLDYSVEWRVIDASTYGASQRRRRTFIFAYRNDTKYAKSNKPGAMMNRAFPITRTGIETSIELDSDILSVSENFHFSFRHAGYMKDRVITTYSVIERWYKFGLLGSVLQKNVDDSFYITKEQLPKWVTLKDKKNVPRVSSNGHSYIFSEGAMSLPDPWDLPGRTMLTSEGSLNRSSHIVADPGNGRLRILTPVEAERLQGFDDGWTDTGMSNRMRYFCMGNSLVVPMITRMAKVLDDILEQEG